jgi:hypothetical protein
MPRSNMTVELARTLIGKPVRITVSDRTLRDNYMDHLIGKSLKLTEVDASDNTVRVVPDNDNWNSSYVKLRWIEPVESVSPIVKGVVSTVTQVDAREQKLYELVVKQVNALHENEDTYGEPYSTLIDLLEEAGYTVTTGVTVS